MIAEIGEPLVPELKPISIDELALSSATYDQPSSEVRAKVFICTTGRTGSWFLCRAMMHHGMGIPHEYFNARHIEVIANRADISGLAVGASLGANATARKAYCQALLARRTVSGLFSAKIHWGQYASYLDNTEGDYLFQNGHFVHLNREDLLSQAISFHVARETGIWGVDAKVGTRPTADRDYFNRDKIDAHLSALAESDSNWRLFFAHNGIKPYRISYERMRLGPSLVVREIAKRFGLAFDGNIPDYTEAEPSMARDRNVPPRSEIRAWYLKGHRRITAAGERNGASVDEPDVKIIEPAVHEGPRPDIIKVEAPEFGSRRRQKICLCMIVKNEAPVIVECLESVRPIIDYWVIADTGSTDGTQDIILRTFKDIPGELHQRPWIDFASNRSEVLALGRTHGGYSFIIDADDRLEITPGSKLPFLKTDSCAIEILHKERRHWRPHIINNSLPWRYEGVIHEFLSCGSDESGKRVLPENLTQRRISGLKIIVGEGGARRRRAASDRFGRDAELLRRRLETETDPFLLSRYTYYLAQSCQNSGNLKDALAYYLKRAELGFWDQEIYVSLYRAANLMGELDYDAEDVIATYSRAQSLDKDRAEAFYGAARYCRVDKRYEEGYQFAKAALKLGPLEHALFLEQWIYDYALMDEYAVCAYWVGKFAECLRVCRQLIRERKMPDSMMGRVQTNAQYAQEKLTATAK